LAVSALLAGDMPQVIATLQNGISSARHQQFVQQLISFPNINS
jgi:hypothetical protein